MVVFAVVVRPFLDRLCGLTQTARQFPIQATLSRNLASAQGRVDYVRVRLYDATAGSWPNRSWANRD